MGDGLYLPDGSFQPFSALDLSTELATRKNAGVFFGELTGWLSVLPDPDPVLKKRGDEADILRDLSADDQVATAMLSRKNRVLNCPHFTSRAGAVDGQEPDAIAKTLFDRLQKDMERFNLRSIISAMLDAPFFGFTPLELIWKFGGDWWHLVDIIARPPHWFRFNSENKPVFVGDCAALGPSPALGMRRPPCGEYGLACAQPIELPPGKFVFVTHHATYDNPYGIRLLSRCLWPVSFKRGGLSFYARFVERHGMPWVVGEAPVKAEASEKQEMARNLSRMVQDAVAVIPNGAKVTLESAGQTQSEIHEKFLSRQDKAISKILMGQTLTVEMEGKNSQAAAQTHNDVAEGLADSDKAMVCDAWNEIAWLYARVNAGPDVLTPVFAYDEPEDLNGLADLDKKLAEIGVQFTAEHFTEKYQLKEGEFRIKNENEDSITEFAAPQKSTPGRFAEKAQETLDKAIVAMLPKALQASNKFVGEIEKAIHEARSFEELNDSLVELCSPALTPAGLENFLACALTAAAGHGACAVEAEIEADAQ